MRFLFSWEERQSASFPSFLPFREVRSTTFPWLFPRYSRTKWVREFLKNATFFNLHFGRQANGEPELFSLA